MKNSFIDSEMPTPYAHMPYSLWDVHFFPSANALLLVNVTVPSKDLPLEFLSILVPELGSFTVQWRCATYS